MSKLIKKISINLSESQFSHLGYKDVDFMISEVPSKLTSVRLRFHRCRLQEGGGQGHGFNRPFI